MKRIFPLLIAMLAMAGALWAAEPALKVTPAELNFIAATGQKDVPEQHLSLWLGDRARHWKIQVEKGADWLKFTPAEGDGSVAKMTAHATVAHAGLKAGDYASKVIVTLDGQPDTRVELPVTLKVFELKDVFDVGGRKQLFIDKRFIESSKNIRLKVNPPLKLGRLQDADGKDWMEAHHLDQVIDEPGKKARLYYGVETMNVAESEDGIRWTKTSIAIPSNTGTMMIDQRDVPERRYKLVYPMPRDSNFMPERFRPDVDGITVFTSPDGENFKPASRVLPMWLDNPLVPMWDERIGKYVIFSRAHQQPSTDWEKKHGVENQRRVTRIETDDLLAPWPYDKRFPLTYQHNLMTTKQFPPVLQADKWDYRWSDFYYNATTIYPYAQDVYLMFTANFEHFRPEYHTWIKPLKGRTWEDYGLIEIQLAVSRDGIHWDRPERIPYVAMGRADQWDRFLLTPSPGMVRRGNDLFQYYYSAGRTHDANLVRPEEYANATPHPGGMGIVKQRLDGFVSADTDEKGGFIETPPIVFSGKKLRLNIETGSMGFAHVEIRDAQGQPIPGFELKNSEEIDGNYVDYYAAWKGNGDVSKLAGKPVKLYIKMTRAKLYGFQFTEK